MSGGREHLKTSTALGLVLGLVGVFYFQNLITAVALSFGSIGLGTLWSPDLDQSTRSFFENKLLKSKNPVIKIFGYAHLHFWYPYAHSFAHRSFWTHGPLVGTLIRTLYILAFIATAGIFQAFYYINKNILIFLLRLALAFLLILCYDYVQSLILGLSDVLPYLGFAWIGWLVSDTAHYIQDQMYSFFSKWRRA